MLDKEHSMSHTWVESNEFRLDRSLRQAKANLHPVVHVRNTEAVRVLGHCKVVKERRILTQKLKAFLAIEKRVSCNLQRQKWRRKLTKQKTEDVSNDIEKG